MLMIRSKSHQETRNTELTTVRSSERWASSNARRVRQESAIAASDRTGLVARQGVGGAIQAHVCYDVVSICGSDLEQS